VFSTDGAAISDWSGAFAATTPDQAGQLDAAKDQPGLPLDREPARFQADVRRLTPPTDRTRSNS
jgi:hypothetical protein